MKDKSKKISRIQSKSQGKCLEGFCQVFSVNFLQLSKKEKRNFPSWINVNLRLGKGLFFACLNVEKHWNKRCPTFSQLLNSTFLQAPSQSIWVAKWTKLSVKFFAPIFIYLYKALWNPHMALGAIQSYTLRFII